MKFYTRYDHEKCYTDCEGVSMTDPQYKDECDIDKILKRYKAGEPLPVNNREGRFGDFSEVGDFSSCLDRVNNAISDFESLPAVVRARFGNDPRAFYAFTLDPANTEECVKLGLREAPVVVEKEVTDEKSAEPAPNGEGNA